MATSCPPNCLQGTPLWSLYDVTDNNPEFCLYESVVSEYTDISGFPVYYYRAISNMDPLYGEDSNQDFTGPIETKLVYEPTEEPNIIDMFGIKSDDTLQYTLIPKANFSRDVASGDDTITPMPGDVIKTLWNNRNYEIVDIGSEQNIFMGKRLIWEFILRPYRFSEESTKAEEIHRSTIGVTYIYIYPDGLLADVTHPDGSIDVGVDVTTLGLDLTTLVCGSTYAKNSDGSIDVYNDTLVVEDEKDPHPEYTGQSNETAPLEDKISDNLGDGDWIETESDNIDNYGDVDTKIFGF